MSTATVWDALLGTLDAADTSQDAALSADLASLPLSVLSARNSNGDTLLRTAARRGLNACVATLLNRGVQVEQRSLFHALQSGNLNTVRLLYLGGAKLQALREYDTLFQSGSGEEQVELWRWLRRLRALEECSAPSWEALYTDWKDIENTIVRAAQKKAPKQNEALLSIPMARCFFDGVRFEHPEGVACKALPGQSVISGELQVQLTNGKDDDDKGKGEAAAAAAVLAGEGGVTKIPYQLVVTNAIFRECSFPAGFGVDGLRPAACIERDDMFWARSNLYMGMCPYRFGVPMSDSCVQCMELMSRVGYQFESDFGFVGLEQSGAVLSFLSSCRFALHATVQDFAMTEDAANAQLRKLTTVVTQEGDESHALWRPSLVRPGVKVLDASRRGLMALSLVGFNFLMELDLSNNKLKAWRPVHWGECPLLSKVDLSHNEIETIKGDLSAWPSLAAVNLSYNLLREVDDKFTKLPRLVGLDLSNNRLTELHFSAFTTCTSLQYLDLSNNNLQVSALGDFSLPSSLLWLKLSGNRLTSAPPVISSLSELEYLWLDRNAISDIDFPLPSKLKEVHLQHNVLQTLSAASFCHMQSEGVLVNLSFNLLHSAEQLVNVFASRNMTLVVAGHDFPASHVKLQLDEQVKGASRAEILAGNIGFRAHRYDPTLRGVRPVLFFPTTSPVVARLLAMSNSYEDLSPLFSLLEVYYAARDDLTFVKLELFKTLSFVLSGRLRRIATNGLHRTMGALMRHNTQNKGVKKSLSAVMNGMHESAVNIISGHLTTGVDRPLLLVGPSGAGKSYFLKRVEQVTGLPTVTISAPALNASGYKGLTLTEKSGVLALLHRKMQVRNASSREQVPFDGIIVFDEFDKLVLGADSKRALMDELLLLLDTGSGKVSATVQDEEVHEFEVSRILRICLGAFDGMDDIVRGHHKKLSAPELKQWPQVLADSSDRNVMLKEFGMTDNLAKRFDIVPLESPGEQQFMELLKGKRLQLIGARRLLDSPYGFGLRTLWNREKLLFVHKEFAEAVVAEALQQDAGYRALSAVMNKAMKCIEEEVERAEKQQSFRKVIAVGWSKGKVECKFDTFQIGEKLHSLNPLKGPKYHFPPQHLFDAFNDLIRQRRGGGNS